MWDPVCLDERNHSKINKNPKKKRRTWGAPCVGYFREVILDLSWQILARFTITVNYAPWRYYTRPLSSPLHVDPYAY